MIHALVRCGGTEKLLTGERGMTVMEVLRGGGVLLDAPCGGCGRCGKCAVKVSGALSPLSPAERDSFTAQRLSQGFRLACLARAQGDITVELPSENPFGITSDFAAGKQEAQALFGGAAFGMAADIGTTTLAARFFDLESCTELFAASAVNPQRQYGADVISRIEACRRYGTETLSRTVCGALDAMCASFCAKFHCDAQSIQRRVFAGNTVMQHIAAGISPGGMATFPFEPATLFANGKADAQTGSGSAAVSFVPCVSEFVGGDSSAGMLACSFDTLEEPSLLVDIGTNGEMALLYGGTILCCSTAAGPAFEGAHISCGMGSLPGAISRVFVKHNAVSFETIGNEPPRGICGSGLIDSVAALLELGLLDETGAFSTNDLGNDSDGGTFSFGDSNVFLSQKDVREVQLAKSAIASGIDCLLHTAGLVPSAVKHVFIAGGFGANIDIKSACRIGLLPAAFAAVAVPVGNSSLTGASMLLLDDKNWSRIAEIIARCRTLELSDNAFFQERFIENMLFNI